MADTENTSTTKPEAALEIIRETRIPILTRLGFSDLTRKSYGRWLTNTCDNDGANFGTGRTTDTNRFNRVKTECRKLKN